MLKLTRALSEEEFVFFGFLTRPAPELSTDECAEVKRVACLLLDRLTHRVHILEANGQSYRLQDAKGRLKRK